MVLVSIISQHLYYQVDMNIYYVVNFARYMTEKDFFYKKYNIEICEMIAPLMMYPHMWIRNEALQYINLILEKYSDVDIYTFFQPRLVKFLSQNVSIINKEILQMLAPSTLQIERKLLSKQTKIDKNNFGGNSAEQIQMFQQHYLSKVKMHPDNVIQQQAEEIRSNFQKKLSDIIENE